MTLFFFLGRHYLLRDVYDDMKLDGVQPTADIFHSFVVGTMKGARLSDAFFFREEMKAMGIAPDVCPMILFFFALTLHRINSSC